MLQFHEKDAVVNLLLEKAEGARHAKDVSQALAWDDLTGMRLDAGKVREARQAEIAYFKKKSC